MPSGSRFTKREGTFSKLVDAEISGTPRILNAIDFIESQQGLNVKLYPLQRLIVKCVLGVPVDYKEGMIPLYDVFREKLERTVRESECLHILYEEGRANVRDWRDIPPRGFNEACIIAGRRGGKLISVDELIPTPTGFVRNGDLDVNDKIFGEDGRIYQVQVAHPIVEEEAFRVSFNDGTSVFAHAGHLWHTFTFKERKNLARRKTVQELPSVPKGQCKCGCGRSVSVAKWDYGDTKKGQLVGWIKGHQGHYAHHTGNPILGKIRTTQEIADSLMTTGKKPHANHAVRLSSPVILPDASLLVDPYCLGYWLGDGNSDCGIITADPKDACEVLPYFVASGYRWHSNPNNRIRWHILGLQASLSSLNVIKNKHIPHDYLWGSSAQRLALLQGLCDSNGHCAKDGRVEFCNKNEALSRGVYHLAASLGIKPYWTEKESVCYNTKDGPKKCGTVYLVHWTSALPCFRLPRKLARISRKLKATQGWRHITTVEPVGKMQMRCITTTNPTGLYLFGKNFNVTHNSQVVSAIGGYKLYQLLNKRSPQEYFGLVPGSPIDFTFLAQDDEGAARLYDKLREDVNRAPFFSPYLKANSGSWMGFVTESDRGKRDITPTVNVSSWPCTTSSVRGPSSVFLALDEFAHFRSEKGSTSDEVYAAATPSTLNFHHAELHNGEWISSDTMHTLPQDQYKEYQDSLILSISTPWTRVGKMYELHRLAMDKGIESNIFTMRVSTAEMNPTVLSKFLHTEYDKNPMTFKAEFGGNFLDSSESYVTEVQVRACTDVLYTKDPIPKPVLETARLNLISFTPSCVGRKYFWGIDLGMMKNATAVAIAHLEHKGGKNPIELVFDYIDRMMVGEKFYGPGILTLPGLDKYIGYRALPLDDIMDWLKALNKVMPCFRGATDQHGGQQLVQHLATNQILNVELLNLSTTINSQMAFALKGYMENSRCRFPFVPKFMDELRLVEAEFVGKYQIRVQAPEEKNATDDMVDAAQEVAFVAQKWLMEEGGLLQDPTGESLTMNEQLSKPAAPLVCIDGVSMQNLKVMEKMRKLQTGLMMSPGAVVVSNPFHRRMRR